MDSREVTFSRPPASRTICGDRMVVSYDFKLFTKEQRKQVRQQLTEQLRNAGITLKTWLDGAKLCIRFNQRLRQPKCHSKIDRLKMQIEFFLATILAKLANDLMTGEETSPEPALRTMDTPSTTRSSGQPSTLRRRPHQVAYATS
jgi:hypothetical protein